MINLAKYILNLKVNSSLKNLISYACNIIFNKEIMKN